MNLVVNAITEWFKCNERLYSFGSLHDGSYLGIRKDATIEVVWGRPFPFIEANRAWVEDFNAVVHSCVPVLTNIGYCPMIYVSPTEFWPRSAIV